MQHPPRPYPSAPPHLSIATSLEATLQQPHLLKVSLAFKRAVQRRVVGPPLGKYKDMEKASIVSVCQNLPLTDSGISWKWASSNKSLLLGFKCLQKHKTAGQMFIFHPPKNSRCFWKIRGAQQPLQVAFQKTKETCPFKTRSNHCPPQNSYQGSCSYDFFCPGFRLSSRWTWNPIWHPLDVTDKAAPPLLDWMSLT